MIILDGKATAATIRRELKARTQALFAHYGKKVGLAVILIGENSASQIYVRNKIKACAEAGIESFAYTLPASTTQEEALALIQKLGHDDAVHGILLQLPVPAHLNANELLSAIPSEKDADGFSAEHLGLLAQNQETVSPCTPAGIMELLRRYQIEPRGKHALIVGRSNIVGKPIAMLLLNADATVTVCHSKTRNLKEICQSADILVACAGRANLITADMVKEGAVVIDVGMNRTENGLAGDVDYANVSKKASYITPVPGGVGPMTIAMLLYNVCNAAEKQFETK